MAMKETVEIINAMEADSVIRRYAIAGAVAAYNYIEPAMTDDLNILISFYDLSDQASTGLVTLAPIFCILRRRDLISNEKKELLLPAGPFNLCQWLTLSIALKPSWQLFCRRTGIPDPCNVNGVS